MAFGLVVELAGEQERIVVTSDEDVDTLFELALALSWCPGQQHGQIKGVA